MDVLKEVEIKVGAGRGAGRGAGIFEEYLLDKERMTSLLGLPKGSVAVVPIEEIGSEGTTSNGCCYGLNKVFVAGELPLRSTPAGRRLEKSKYVGKKCVIIRHTGEYNVALYATDETIEERVSETAYEQPSDAQIERVKQWLIDNEFVETT